MKHISIGGLDVSRIGLGAMSMSGYYNPGAGSEGESIRAIHRAGCRRTPRRGNMAVIDRWPEAADVTEAALAEVEQQRSCHVQPAPAAAGLAATRTWAAEARPP